MLKRDIPYDFAEEKELTQMNRKELKYIQTPVPKAVYKNKVIRNEDAGQPTCVLRFNQRPGPIGKKNGQNVYKDSYNGRTYGEEKVKAHPNDVLICEFCGKTYTRSNRPKHRKTEVCQVYQKMNKKLRDIMIYG
ncbi:hypothetical protein za3_3 [Zamilon virus]|uniref:Uncharacterized protein n=1 Tax=Zamilon virus TaxID=1411887 RepID=A0A2P1EHJ6_9VIRU|nr:hypothetical protein za3_3 [Zamilon virus]